MKIKHMIPKKMLIKQDFKKLAIMYEVTETKTVWTRWTRATKANTSNSEKKSIRRDLMKYMNCEQKRDLSWILICR
jgi:hypothetical protein